MRKVKEEKEKEKIVLEVEEDVKVNDDTILEKGDKIQVLEKEDEQHNKKK